MVPILHRRARQPARRLRGVPVIVATAALGHAISGEWDAARRRNVLKFGVAALACAVAALANPYGFGLYRHVAHLLFSSGVTSLIVEYQPAPFGKPEAKVLEWVLLAFVALAGRVGATDRALSVGPCPRVAASGTDVDPQRPVFRPGVGAGAGDAAGGPAPGAADVVETR